jgi:hypothetical protein
MARTERTTERTFGPIDGKHKPLLSDAEHWRRRAADMRALAADMSDDHTRALILEIAAGYDQLAIRADLRQGPLKF